MVIEKRSEEKWTGNRVMVAVTGRRDSLGEILQAE